MSSSSFMSDNLKTDFLACGIGFNYMTLVGHNDTVYLSLQKPFTSAPKLPLFPSLWLSIHFAPHDLH